MAGKGKDKPITEIAADPKRLEEIAALLAQVSEETEVLSESQGAAAVKAEELIALLEKRTNLYDKLIEQKQKEITLAGRGDDKKAEALAKEIEGIEKAEEIYKKAIATKKKLLEGELKEEVTAHKQKSKAAADAQRLQTNLLKKEQKDQLRDLKELTVRSGNAAFDASKQLVSSAGPILSTLAVFRKDLALDPVLFAIQNEFATFDDNYRSIVKSTGLNAKSMQDAFTNAINPTEVRDLFTQMEMPLVDIGITSKDSAASMKAVLQGAATFRPSFMEANQATSAFTVNLVAGLKKIGVAEQHTVKNIDIFNKALGKTPDQANRAVKQLHAVADSLEIDVGKAFKDFAALMPDLAAYGDRAVEVFGELEAQARATGMEVGRLNKFAQGLDTFKGAAEVAQRFNAVMGDTYLSVTDLVEADPADKIAMIQQAMSDAGVSFEDADRRMRQVITSALGLKDVESAARILGNKEEFEEAAAGLDTSATSQEELTKKIQDSLTQAETLTRGISRMGAGFRQFSDRTRKLAVGGANAITESFEAARHSISKDNPRGAEAAAIGMLINIKGMVGAAGEFEQKMKKSFETLKTMATAFGAGGIVAHIGADVYEAGSVSQRKQLDNLGKNYRKNKKEIDNIVKAIKKSDKKKDEVKEAIEERRARRAGGAAGAVPRAAAATLTREQERRVTEVVAQVKALTPAVTTDDLERFRESKVNVYIGREQLEAVVIEAVERELSK